MYYILALIITYDSVQMFTIKNKSTDLGSKVNVSPTTEKRKIDFIIVHNRHSVDIFPT